MRYFLLVLMFLLVLLAGCTHANEVSLTIPASGDNLTYSASNLPEGATFIGRTFSWTPQDGQEGTYIVCFTVTDPEGLSDSENVTITVNPRVNGCSCPQTAPDRRQTP
jgi:hypothetical protein